MSIRSFFLFPYDSLTLLIPSYLGPTLYTKGEGISTPLVSHQPFVVQTSNFAGSRDILQGPRKLKVSKKSFAWLPWQPFNNIVLSLIIVKMFMKNR